MESPAPRRRPRVAPRLRIFHDLPVAIFLDDELVTLRSSPAIAGLDDAEWALLEPLWTRLKLQAGEEIIRAGEQAPGLFIVLSGRCNSYRGKDLLAVLAPGAALGVRSLLAAERTVSVVRAARDTCLARLSPEAFEQIAPQVPRLLRGLGRIVASRAGDSSGQGPASPPIRNLAVLCFDERAHAATFAHNLKSALVGGRVSEVVDQRAIDRLTGKEGVTHAFSQMELVLDFTITVPDPLDSEWTRRCLRQADRIVLLAMGDSNPRVTTTERHVLSLIEKPDCEVHLVLLHPPETALGSNTLEWLDRRELGMHLHVRLGNADDYGRAARMLTDTAVGLVLGGASTRGIAHLGVVDALRQAGVPIDLVVGSSSGALVAGLLALQQERDEAIESAFSVLSAIAPKLSTMGPPVVSIASGKVPSDTCRALWGERRLEDLFIPCIFTATDLARSQLVELRRGPVWRCARAATSLPVIWPPVIEGEQVLIDGGVLDNLPFQSAVPRCRRGLMFAVDLNPPPGQDILPVFANMEQYGEVLSGWGVAWNKFAPGTRPKRFPGLADTLTYTMLLASIRHAAELERNAPPNLHLIRIALPDEGFFAVDRAAGLRLVEHAATAARPAIEEAWRTHREGSGTA